MRSVILFFMENDKLNSQKWLTCNFSLWYPYITQQTGNENTQTHQVEVVILIKHQILIINLWENVWQLEGRINNQILGVKGLYKH